MKWLFINKFYDENFIKRLYSKYNFPEYISKVFINRGFDTLEKIDKILNVDKLPLNTPFLFENIEIAIERIKKAINNKEKIIIYGDYDVDGITAITILIKFLKENLAYNFIDFYIPHRQEEGYGLNKDAIDFISRSGYSLLITVDCGINSKEEVNYAMKKGIDVIITDHHLPDTDKMPEDAIAVINPKCSKNYPNKELSGVGVAYKLICALAEKLQIEIKDKFIDFVAMGTIADIVPLTFENRIIIRRGLKKLEDPDNLGLKILKEKCGLKKNQPITSYHIGYILGPRINAAGRLEHAKKALKLFLSEDINEVEQISDYLNNINKERKTITEQIEKEALKKLEEKFDIEKDFLISLYEQSWNAGVIGLVASKISKKFYRPTIIFTKGEDGLLHGSARSIGSINIYDILKSAEQHIEKFGGHRLAAGVTLKESKFELFNRSLNEYLLVTQKKEDFEMIIYVDDIIKDKIDLKDIKIFNLLQPWGEGNSAPSFIMENVEIMNAKLFKNNTLKFYGKHNGKYYNFIIFNYEEDKDNSINEKNIYDIIFSPVINIWNGEENLLLEVKSFEKKS